MDPVAAEPLSNDEVASAIAEVESAAPAAPPAASTSDAPISPAAEVVAVPVPGPGVGRPRIAEQAPPALVPEAPAPPLSEETPAVPVALAPADALAPRRSSAAESPPAAGLLWRVLDWLLAAINRPFEGLSPAARQAVGLIALVTIVLSLLAGLVLPQVLPRQDAMSYLQRVRADAAAQVATAEPAGAAAEAHAAQPSH